MMEGIKCIHLSFNVDADDYLEFIDDLSTALADVTNCNTDNITEGSHRLLPKQVSGKPERWMCIELLTTKDEHSKEIMKTTLKVRDDNVYLTGFKNQRNKWYEFGNAPTMGKKSSTKGKKKTTMRPEEEWKQVHLIPDSTFLGFTGRHNELLSSTRWTCKEAKLGKYSAKDVVKALSEYDGEGSKKDSIKQYLFRVIVMISESARMIPYRKKVDSGWGVDAGVTLEDADKNLTEYLHNWKHMSKAMMEENGDIQACEVVHLILNSSKDKEKNPNISESAGGDDPENETPGGGNDSSSQGGGGNDNGQSSMQGGGSDDQSSRQQDGSDQSSQKGGDDGKSSRQQEHSSNGHPPQPTDGTEYAGHCLVEVFTLGPANSDISFLRSITVFDGRLGQIIFWNEEGDTDTEGNFILEGPYRGISADGRVALKIIGTTEAAESETDVPIWDPYTEDEHKYDEILTKNIQGDLNLKYAVLSRAVEASVQVDVFLFENIAVYGEITVQSLLASLKKATVVLVRYDEVGDQLDLVASSAGYRIPLTRSVVAWPIGSPINIEVDCFHPVTSEGTSSSASVTTTLNFSFGYDTPRVCFKTLDGIGHVRVSVDDTREYRDGPDNSLPRALKNQFTQENQAAKIGSLVVHPSQLTFTFGPNKIMSCLVHLTNTTYEKHIAFRFPPGENILTFSGIVPPDSTSTYLVRRESPQAPNMDSFSFTLQSCVVPKATEEEDLDQFFNTQPIHGCVEHKTLHATCQIIPSAGQGSHHSIDVPQKDPSMARDLTALMGSTVEARVQVDLFLFKKTDFYGKITAHSQLASGEEVSVLFNCGIKDKVDILPSSTARNVPLTRSVVVWHVDSPLLIKVSCFHSVTFSLYGLDFRSKGGHLFRSTADTPSFEGLEFSFDANTDKVRFATLEGFGYICVSVDDTGKYRQKPSSSLPRSLMKNAIETNMSGALPPSREKKIETDTCKDTKFLVIRHSYLTPWLLHVTNKSDDQHVAFRCGETSEVASSIYKEPIGWRWKLSDVLPPDSTSTYLLLEAPKMIWLCDVVSLILQSRAASEDEKHVETFFNLGKNEIEEVTLSFPERTYASYYQYIYPWMDPWTTIFDRPGQEITEVTLRATVSDTSDVTMTSQTQMEAPITESSIEQNDMLDVYPLQLCFPFKLNKTMCCPLRLTNKTDGYVIFKFLPYTIYNELYLCQDILPPRSTCTYVVATKKQKYVPDNMDKLSMVLKSCPIENITGKDKNLSSQDLMHGAIPKAISDAEPIHPKMEMFTTEGFPIFSMDVHPTKPWILCGDKNANVSIWNYQTQAEENNLKVPNVTGPSSTGIEVTSVKFIAHGKWFAAGLREGFINVFSCTSCTTIRAVKRIEAHTRLLTSLAVHPNQTCLLSASVAEYDAIKLWKWNGNPDAEWECVQRYSNYSGLMRHVTFNPYDNGNTFASASEDCKVKIWSTNDQDSSPNPIAILDCGEDMQQSVAYFSLGGQQYIITTGPWHWHRPARVWDLRTNICIKKLVGAESTLYGNVVGVVDSARDNINPVLITVSKDNSISFLDAITYESRYEKVNFFLGEPRGFTCVDVEGKRSLVIALSDGIAIMEMNKDHIYPTCHGGARPNMRSLAS